MMNLQPNFMKTTAWLLKCLALPYKNWLETYNSSTYIALLTQCAMVKQSYIYMAVTFTTLSEAAAAKKN